MGDHSMTLLVCALSVLSVSQLVQSDNYYDNYPHLTIVENAVSKGAVCLDGTPPAYQIREGYGEGVNDWTIHLEGGGWCKNDTDCVGRILGFMGSSRRISEKLFSGIQSPNETLNPYFYNWNKVYVRYCDGASFLADVEEPKVVDDYTLYFRGARVFKAIVEDLLVKGMKNARNILLSGNSAGGLANLLQCDNFRSLVPNVPRVKCLADSAFFIHGKNLPALELRENEVFDIVEYHVFFHASLSVKPTPQLAKQLPKSCTLKMDPRLCLFPEYFAGDIQTPLFMVQSAYDSYQLKKRTEHERNATEWETTCYKNISLCSPTEVKSIRDFATTLVEKLPKPSSRGLFVDSCNTHDQILWNTWHNVPEPTLHNKVLELGIVVHSVVIGLSLGASENPCTIRPLVAALCFHQLFEGMGLGGCIMQAEYGMKVKATMVFFFSATTPFGIALGIGLSKVYSDNSPTALIVVGLLNACSAGLLNYMALVDLLASDFMGAKLQKSMKLQSWAYVCVLLGAGGMSVMAIWA